MMKLNLLKRFKDEIASNVQFDHLIELVKKLTKWLLNNNWMTKLMLSNS